MCCLEHNNESVLTPVIVSPIPTPAKSEPLDQPEVEVDYSFYSRLESSSVV